MSTETGGVKRYEYALKKSNTWAARLCYYSNDFDFFKVLFLIFHYSFISEIIQREEAAQLHHDGSTMV